MVVVYPDGVVELKNGDGQTLGMKKLKSILSQHLGAEARGTRDSVMNAVGLFSLVVQDDVTLLVFSLCGISGVTP